MGDCWSLKRIIQKFIECKTFVFACREREREQYLAVAASLWRDTAWAETGSRLSFSFRVDIDSTTQVPTTSLYVHVDSTHWPSDFDDELYRTEEPWTVFMDLIYRRWKQGRPNCAPARPMMMVGDVVIVEYIQEHPKNQN